jgi:hypothetical protein
MHGRNITPQSWTSLRDTTLKTYLPQRTALVLGQFRTAGLYPNIDAPVFYINGSYQHGGHITASDSLSMKASSGTIWYTLDGSDPRVPGQTAPTGAASSSTLVAENAPKRVLVTSQSTSVGGGGVSTTGAVMRYVSPMTLSRSARVKARTLSGTTWSALNEAVYAVGPVAQSLRVSELMYHPLDTGNPNDPNTEFIELTNIANQNINLNFVQFTQGIDYTFPSFDLPAGGYCLVVKDLTAFQAKYGSGSPTQNSALGGPSKLPVVGVYAGSFSNAGERVELVDAAGTVIQSFEYQDDWYKSTDGLGYSLTGKGPKTTDANSLNDKNAWRPSTSVDGSPGSADAAQ